MKEKTRNKKAEKRDYFYELTAALTITTTLVIFSELGMVGVTLKRLSKILVGDFYFVLIIFFFFHGVYALIKHKWFDKTSIRFNGFLLFFTTLLMVSHISFYEQLSIQPQAILSKTISLFQGQLQGSWNLKTYGGGIIGALLLQIFLILFQKTGTILIAVVFFILSISFMANISIKSLIFKTSDEVKKIRGNASKIFDYFKNIKYPTKTSKKSNEIHLNLLEDFASSEDSLIQSKMALELKDKLNRTLVEHSFYVKETKMQIGYTQTRLIAYGDFRNSPLPLLPDIQKENPIIYIKQRELIIELPNKIKRLLTLKALLLESKSNEIPLGIEVSNEIISFHQHDKHLLIIGCPNSGVRTFLRAFLVSAIFKISQFSLCLFDLNSDFPELKYLPNLLTPYINSEQRLKEKIDLLAVELEKRLSLISTYNVNDFQELNARLRDTDTDCIKPLFLIINGDIANSEVLSYFLKFGHKAGIFVILAARKAPARSMLADFSIKLILKLTSLDDSFALLENHNACLLERRGDALLLLTESIKRVQLPFIGNEDYKKIISKFIT